MNESLPQPTSPGETATDKTPLDLKLFYGFLVVLVVGMVGLLVFWWPGTAGPPPQPPDHPRRLGEFSLTDQTGRAVTQVEFVDKFVIVNFLHTSCSVSCLRVNQQMAEVQRLTAGRVDVRLLSLTVDPRTDTPPVLLEFGNKFGADTNRWSLLTGDKATLYDLIETSFLKRERFSRCGPHRCGGSGRQRPALLRWHQSGNARRHREVSERIKC